MHGGFGSCNNGDRGFTRWSGLGAGGGRFTYHGPYLLLSTWAYVKVHVFTPLPKIRMVKIIGSPQHRRLQILNLNMCGSALGIPMTWPKNHSWPLCLHMITLTNPVLFTGWWLQRVPMEHITLSLSIYIHIFMTSPWANHDLEVSQKIFVPLLTKLEAKSGVGQSYVHRKSQGTFGKQQTIRFCRRGENDMVSCGPKVTVP